MSRAAHIDLVDGETKVLIEYVRTRKVLRISGDAFDAFGQWGPFEIPLADLVRELQVDVSGLAPAQPYMVFGGEQSLGGSKDCLGTFATEAEAKKCFVALRQNRSTAWAEVSTVVKGRLRQLCWFGAPELVAGSSRRRWRR